MMMKCPDPKTLSNSDLDLTIERICETRRALSGDLSATIYIFGHDHDGYVASIWAECDRRYIETLKLTGEEVSGPFGTENELAASRARLESL